MVCDVEETTEKVASEVIVIHDSDPDPDPVSDGPSHDNVNGEDVPSGSDETSTHQPQGISADEVALYDRQIRLWGFRAQEKIRQAHILLITCKALGNEIAKNLVLAGVGALTIHEESVLTQQDFFAQFLAGDPRENIGKNRADVALIELAHMNPRVRLAVDREPGLLSRDPEWYRQFSLIIATDIPFHDMSRVNILARRAGRPFYGACINGFYGFVFADLIKHRYIIERSYDQTPTKVGRESLTRRVISVKVKGSRSKAGKPSFADTDASSETGSSAHTGSMWDNERMEIVEKEEKYCSMRVSVTSPLSREILVSKRRMARVTPLLACYRAWFEYQLCFPSIPLVPPPKRTKPEETARTESENYDKTDDQIDKLAEMHNTTITTTVSAQPNEVCETNENIEKEENLNGDDDEIDPEADMTYIEHYVHMAIHKHRTLGLPQESLTPEFLRLFLLNLTAELPPTASFIGAYLSQDVINVLSQREQPLQNWLFFDGDNIIAPKYALHRTRQTTPVE